MNRGPGSPILLKLAVRPPAGPSATGEGQCKDTAHMSCPYGDEEYGRGDEDSVLPSFGEVKFSRALVDGYCDPAVDIVGPDDAAAVRPVHTHAAATEETDDELLGAIGSSRSPAVAVNRNHVRMDQEDFVLSTIPEIEVARTRIPIDPGELLCRFERREEWMSRAEIYVAERFRSRHLNKNHVNQLASKILRHGYSEHSGRLVVARVVYKEGGRKVSHLTLADGQHRLAAFDSILRGDIEVSDEELRHLKDLAERFPVVIYRSGNSEALDYGELLGLSAACNEISGTVSAPSELDRVFAAVSLIRYGQEVGRGLDGLSERGLASVLMQNRVCGNIGMEGHRRTARLGRCFYSKPKAFQMLNRLSTQKDHGLSVSVMDFAIFRNSFEINTMVGMLALNAHGKKPKRASLRSHEVQFFKETFGFLETAREMVAERARLGHLCTLTDILLCQTYGADGKPLTGMSLIAETMANFKGSESRAVGDARIARNKAMFREAIARSMPLPQAQRAPLLPDSVAARTSLVRKMVSASKASTKRTPTKSISGYKARIVLKQGGVESDWDHAGGIVGEKDESEDESINVDIPPLSPATVNEGEKEEISPDAGGTVEKCARRSETFFIPGTEVGVRRDKDFPPHYFSEARYCEAIGAFDAAEEEYDRGRRQTYKKGETHKKPVFVQVMIARGVVMGLVNAQKKENETRRRTGVGATAKMGSPVHKMFMGNQVPGEASAGCRVSVMHGVFTDENRDGRVWCSSLTSLEAMKRKRLGQHPFGLEKTLPYDSRAVIKQRIIELLRLKHLDEAVRNVDGGITERLGVHAPGGVGRDLELWREFLGEDAQPSTALDVSIPSGNGKQSTNPIPIEGLGSFDMQEEDNNYLYIPRKGVEGSEGKEDPVAKVVEACAVDKDTGPVSGFVLPVAPGAKRKVSWADSAKGALGNMAVGVKEVSGADCIGEESRPPTKKSKNTRENPGERPFDNVLTPVPVLVLKSMAKRKAADEDQEWAREVLRSSFFPEDHRSFAYIGSDEVRSIMDHVCLYGARASFERWAGEGLTALPGQQVLDPNNIRDKMLAAPQWERVFADLQDAGFSVLSGFFETDEGDMLQSDVSLYLEHFHDDFTDEQAPGCFREIINLGVKKDVGSIAAGMARFITPNDAVNETLEKKHPEVYKRKLRIEASIGLAAKQVGLNRSTWRSSESVGGVEENELEFPRSGSRVLLTGRNCHAQNVHMDFERNSPSGRSWRGLEYPGYFFMFSGKDPFVLRVWRSSHKFVDGPDNDVKKLSAMIPCELITVPPFSLLFARGDLVHAGAADADNRWRHALNTKKVYKRCLRGHGYLPNRGYVLRDNIYSESTFKFKH